MQFDGLDTIGDFDEDYGSEYESSSDTDDDSEMVFDQHMEGMEDELVDLEPIPIEQEVQVGYEEKKFRMWIHYKHACARGDVIWLKIKGKRESTYDRPRPLRRTAALASCCRRRGRG